MAKSFFQLRQETLDESLVGKILKRKLVNPIKNIPRRIKNKVKDKLNRIANRINTLPGARLVGVNLRMRKKQLLHDTSFRGQTRMRIGGLDSSERRSGLFGKRKKNFGKKPVKKTGTSGPTKSKTGRPTRSTTGRPT